MTLARPCRHFVAGLTPPLPRLRDPQARIEGPRPPAGGCPTRLQTGLEESDILGRDRVAVAPGRAQRREGAQRVEVGREAPDEVEDDLLDPLRVLGEDLENALGVDRL